MSLESKVRILSDAGKFDICASTSCARPPAKRTGSTMGNVAPPGVCHSFTPDGRCVSLFKVLYGNACSMDCAYCTNPCASRKVSFQPKELCSAFMSLYARNYVEGLFLSSAIMGDPEKTMEDMLEAVALLRGRYRFGGYVHLKILPGSSRDQVVRASRMADRISINVETTSHSHLSSISSTKDYRSDILQRQRWMRETIEKGGSPAGQTTQFIVGAAGETDREILDRLWSEYRDMHLKRGYFSAFTPVEGTGLENEKAAPLWREHRLYQGDWLMRVYDFSRQELYGALDDEGMLGNRDPKIELARTYFDKPLDINNASYEELIRVPGIGPTSARRILDLRNMGKPVENRRALKNMGAVVNRAMPFVNMRGWQSTVDGW